MKKTVKTEEGFTIHFSIELEDGTPIDDAGLERLQKNLFDSMLKKAEPNEDELFVLPAKHAS